MSVPPGARLGSYEVLNAIGAGGMGEVYRARDTKLNRYVAMKVLPDAFANDADRLARFTREAQTLAALNHPNIAAIYGIEESGQADAGAIVRALVMEFVEGEDLSKRIARGPIPVADALPIAKQIADALEAAHEQGIVHRDLKPANIKIRPDGTVKVLDFGLAKAMDSPGASGVNAANSPTITNHATQMGLILGTAGYMAPEQARGKPVDRRADIWAFGVVFYEMLTGARAFKGDEIPDVLAAVLRQHIDWTALPAEARGLRHLLERCLDRDVKERLRDIGEARVEIAKIQRAPDAAVTGARDAAAAAVVVPAWRRASTWVASTGLLAVALAASLLMWPSGQSTPALAMRKLMMSVGADVSLSTAQGVGDSVALSPDGTTLAVAALQGNEVRLYVRKLDQLQAVALAGTEGAADPFFSPDGQSVAFFSGGKLKKVAVIGGAAVTLCDAPSDRGGAWTDDRTIIFAARVANGTALQRVSAAGGAPTPFGTVAAGVTSQQWPQSLPDGRGVLYTEHSPAANFVGANLMIAPLSNGTPKLVVRGGFAGRFLPSGLASPGRAERDSGHLIYMQQGTIFAVPFDLNRLETTGDAVQVLDGVDGSVIVGSAQVAHSQDGTLLYVPGGAGDQANPMDWMSRDGKTSVLRSAKAAWANPRFSPDGTKVAMEIQEGKERNIWVYEWARDTLTPLTRGTAQARSPVWTPDGRHITFASDRATPGVLNLYWVSADGSGDVVRLTDGAQNQRSSSWHPSGKFLAFTETRFGPAGQDLMILPMEGDAARDWRPGTPYAFLSTPANEGSPIFSPDGRWIAYLSNEAGTTDVYVRPFPGPGGKWRVSTDSSSTPRWSSAAPELLFINQTLNMFVFAPYTVVGDSFRPDKPQVWSPTSQSRTASGDDDLHPDGKRLVTAAGSAGEGARGEIVLVSNFFEHLRTVAPGRR